MTKEAVESQDDPIIRLARIVHQANKALCESIGDTSQVDWEEADESVRDSAIEGVKQIIANPDITPEQLHDNWSKDKIADGYVYGDVKDDEKKTHPCLVAYDKLPAHQRFKDHLFNNIVKTYINFK
jgi:hypothetical protein